MKIEGGLNGKPIGNDFADSAAQLELLLALTSSDGIAGAGAKLGMSPSATSRALRALEAALGTEVVDRNASGVALTYTGEHILPHVRDVFASLQLSRRQHWQARN